MEPAESKVDEPFGRQPQPVTVTLEGDHRDVAYWLTILRQRAEFKGDSTICHTQNGFRIYPRAVND